MKTAINLGPGSHRVLLRRLSLAALVALTTGAASWQALRVLLVNGFHPLEWLMFPLFVVLVIPIALSFWTAVFGFLVQLRGTDPLALSGAETERAPLDLASFRTAIIIPAYNEDTVRLFAGLKATYDSVDRTGQLQHFDFFVLSDSTDPDAWVREEMAFQDLRQEVRDPGRLFYRNRRDNLERKSGNIADFCTQRGSGYRYMIVFDADSLMTGRSLVNLVRLMERHPTVGILQTPPLPVNRESLFGRLLQFSTRAYGPMFIRGLTWWQAGEGNYWGHNAIIRLRPFMEHCRLPKLPGKAPLGGSILSHDFVEAALIRRAGWKVYMASDVRGSYEETPANLIGHAARDRRWCQGNLQHTRLLRTPGLHWVSRLHLGMGVMAYVSSPLWMLLLALGTLEGLRAAWTTHVYFAPDASPFPVWQVSIVGRAVALFSSLMALMVVPKLLSLVGLLLRHRRTAAGFGGAGKLITSGLAETLFSVLLAPVLAVLHSRFVIGTLLGRTVSWTPPDRGDVRTPLREAVRRHAGITALGLVWSALLAWQTPALCWWLSPVLAGLMLSIPLSVWTSEVSAGRWAKARGLFLIPEEIRPPFLLRRFHEELQRLAARPWATCEDGLGWVLRDPNVRSIHLAFVPRPSQPKAALTENRLEGLRLKVRAAGPSALLPQEKRELLWDADSVEALSQIVES